MTKASFFQRGESLDYKNETTGIIEAGTIIAIGSHIGVAGTEILPGEIGSLHVQGVFEIAKAAETMTMGQTVYFNGTVITTTESGNTPSGYVAAPASAEDTTVLIKLIG